MIENYEPYDNTDEFTLLEAAYLIADKAPPPGINNTPIPYSVQLIGGKLKGSLLLVFVDIVDCAPETGAFFGVN